MARTNGNGRRSSPSRPLHVAILGAGFGGIGMAVRLRQLHLANFTIYEKADGIGGTWRDNSYPGAACDIPSHLYSFSFETPHDWPRRYSEQPDILTYLERLVDTYGLGPHLRLNTEIASARFDESTGQWELRSTEGERFTADVVVSGLGQLNRPYTPALPGIDDFAGTTFHSARWDHNHALTGERVAVIGNGASAVQFIPQIAPEVEELHVYQRTPNWVVPKKDRAYSEATKAVLQRVPAIDKAYRTLIYLRAESLFMGFHRPSRMGDALEKLSGAHLEAQVPDPELRAKLRPDYPIGCKRILITDDYYPTLLRDNVELVTDAIDHVDRDGIVTTDGTHRNVDTIIYGTGFKSTDFLAPLEIIGRDGRNLHDEWRDGAEAYLGIAVSGFPNLFMLYGPNTNLGHNSIIFMLECQIRYILQCLERLAGDGVTWLDVKPEAQSHFNRTLEEQLSRTVWEAGCRSWYKTASGKVTNNWSTFTIRYWLDTRRADHEAFEAHTVQPAPALATV